MKLISDIYKIVFEKHSSLFKNFSYLSILEIIKLMFPLITIPFLMKKLGEFNYGTVAFVQSIMLYATIIINLGLDLSSVKDISCNRTNKVKLDELVSSVFIIKFSIFCFTCICILLSSYIIPFFISNRLLVIVSLSYCFMEIVFPIWYYQGIEKMKYITLIRLISVVVYSILILCFIKQPTDYIYVPVFYGVGALCGGIFSFYILKRKEKIRLYFPNLKTLIYYFKSTLVLFLSRLSAITNTSFSKIISGILLGMEQVALLDLLEKIIGVAKIPLLTVNNTIYPYISRSRDKKMIKFLFRMTLCISAIFCIIVFFSADLLLGYFSGGAFTEYNFLLQLYSINIVLCGVSSFLGVPVLIPFGHTKAFTLSLIISTILLLILYSFAIMILKFSVLYCVLITLIVEAFILFYRYICCKKELIL